MSLPSKPTFIIVGAQRAATRWLRINLGQHPDVFTLNYEADYFTSEETMKRVGARGYMALFRGYNGEPIVGESSPSYSMPANDPATIAGRIAWSYPDIKIFFSIRNPYDRAFSAMLEAIRTGELPDDSRLDQMDPVKLAELQLLQNGAYEWSLDAFKETIGDQLKVLVYDDLLEDTGAFFDEALVHLGLEPGFRPRDLETPMFSTRRLRSSVPLPNEDHRQEVLKFAEPSTLNVERILGRELPGWHPS